MPTVAAEGGPFGGGIEASAESDRPAISPEAAMGSGDPMTAATEARTYMDACTEATQAAIEDGAGPIACEHAADREMNATTAYFNVNPDSDAEMDAEAAKWEADYAAAHPDPGRPAGPQAEAG
jgi:hypothetical protein